MVDTSILGPRIHAKVMDICLNAIVCEAFVDAVPVSKNDRIVGLNHDLRRFAMEAVKDLGGHKLLLSACENQNLDASQKAYLNQIRSICMEAADAVTDRIIEENKDKTTEDLANAAADVSFTEEEIGAISKKASDLCPEELSGLIQEKVLNTIKEEKEAYAKDAELENEIKSAIMDTTTGEVKSDSDGTSEAPTENDGAYESYVKSISAGQCRPTHATMFSKLHELCYEGVLCATESYDLLPFEALGIITRECTFGAFESYSSKEPLRKLETVSHFAMESLATSDAPATTDTTHMSPQETALLAATVIYTLFETLHTMNLYCPAFDEIRKFVDEALPIAKHVSIDKEAFMCSMSDIIRRTYDVIRKAQTVPEVELVEKNLEMVREKCMTASAFEHERNAIGEKFDALQKAVDTKRDALIDAKKNMVTAVESEMDVMRRTRDTMKFSRIASSFGRKPNVASIRCKVDTQGDNVSRQYVAVECFDLSGRRVNNTTVVLDKALEGDALPLYVSSAVKGSNLMSLDKPISITDSRNGKTYFDTRRG